jgi:serine/threonine protein kinase
MGSTPDPEQLRHPRLGPLRIVEDQATVMETSFPVDSLTAYQEWVATLADFENEAVLQPLAHRYEKAGLCGLSGQAVLTFELFPFVLDKEISNRRLNQSSFTEA